MKRLVIASLAATVVAAAVVSAAPELGCGNAKKLKKLPKGCRLGNNAYAFTGGFRPWENASNWRAR